MFPEFDMAGPPPIILQIYAKERAVTNENEVFTVADAILDRIVHTAHKIELTGDSVRKINAKKK